MPAGDVEVGELVDDGVTEDVGVVGHAAAVVALGPDDLGDGVADAAGDGGRGHAVIVRVLMGERGDEEGAEELAGQVLRVGDADAAAEAGKAGAVGGVGVGGDGDAGGAKNGDGIEGVEQVAQGEARFLFGREGFDFGAVEEAGEPIDEWRRRAGGQVGGLGEATGFVAVGDEFEAGVGDDLLRGYGDDDAAGLSLRGNDAAGADFGFVFDDQFGLGRGGKGVGGILPLGLGAENRVGRGEHREQKERDGPTSACARESAGLMRLRLVGRLQMAQRTGPRYMEWATQGAGPAKAPKCRRVRTCAESAKQIRFCCKHKTQNLGGKSR